MVRTGGLSRRDLIKYGGATTVLGCSQALTSARADNSSWAQGIIFEDRTGIGQKTPADPGLGGVLVSNGVDVVCTDSEGRYRLPVADGSIIFVIKPRGWSVRVDPITQLPQHHYVHRPAGTPFALAHRGLSPTGALPDRIDFPLARADEPADYSVLMIADPQPANICELDYIREMVIGNIDGDFAFGITLGDIMSDDLSLYEAYNKLLGQVGTQIWNLPGNHDLNLDAPHPTSARETWKRVFGPTHQAFEYGNAVYILLDNVEPHAPSANGYSYRGRVGADQLTFVRNLLAHVPKGKLIVLAMHIPLVSALDPRDPSSNTADCQALLRLIGDRPCVSFSGHMHTTEHHYIRPTLDNGLSVPHHHHVLTALSGSWWSGPLDARGLPLAQSCDGTPNGYHVLDIRGDGHATRFVPARSNAQMRIMLNPRGDKALFEAGGLFSGRPVAMRDLAETDVVVNVFDGGPRTIVTWEIDGRSSAEMQAVQRCDPLTEELFSRAGTTRKSWVKAELSSHIWQGTLPPDLAPGLHRLSVTATDEYSRRHHNRLIFEVLPA